MADGMPTRRDLADLILAEIAFEPEEPPVLIAFPVGLIVI
jgi:hypothetical protein